MKIVARMLVLFVALEHLGFLVLEMFFWTEPAGLQVFGLSREFALQSASLAANQGLYNGFLAAGLFWSQLNRPDAYAKTLFFLGCVVTAGVFGAATASSSILFVQAVPASVAMLCVYLANRQEA